MVSCCVTHDQCYPELVKIQRSQGEVFSAGHFSVSEGRFHRKPSPFSTLVSGSPVKARQNEYGDKLSRAVGRTLMFLCERAVLSQAVFPSQVGTMRFYSDLHRSGAGQGATHLKSLLLPTG